MSHRQQAIATHLATHRDADEPQPFGKYGGEVNCPDKLPAIWAAMLRQAIADFRGNDHKQRKTAAAFLRGLGMVTEAGELDLHGYAYPPRPKRKAPTRPAHRDTSTEGED